MIFASSVQQTLPAAHMFLNIQSTNDQAQSAGKCCATLSQFTDVDDWFAFHEDGSWHEEQDQTMLEKIWARLHATAPEIAKGAEVFETATPQTIYESVRRKMGMVGATTPLLRDSSTGIEKLFMVGDTPSRGIGLTGIADEALRVVRSLRPE
jgi:phytoene dehydrogenase-like protein